MTHYNLGNTLQLLGGIADQPARYTEAIEAYRDALREYQRDKTPRQWALAQSGLGSTLHSVGLIEGPATLIEAVAARKAALEVLTAENAPIDWANAESGLGMSYIMLGNLERTGKYLADAEQAFEASLKVFTRDTYPLQWAFAQNNLGDAYWNRASYGGSKDDYRRAIEFFESAKAGFTEAGNPFPITLNDKKIALVKEALAK